MPQLARADRRDRKRWKAAHRMRMHSARLRQPSSAEQQRVPYAILAAVGARPKKTRRS